MADLSKGNQQMAQNTTPTTPAAAKPKPPEPPPELREGQIAQIDAAALFKILSSAETTEFQKAKACQRAGDLGATETIPALAALLGDEKLGVYARYGLEPMPGAAADEALREALGKLKGNQLLGVIASIGKRRDAQALPALVKLMQRPEAPLAQAAAAAIGSIGTQEAARALQAALPKASGMMRIILADAALVCAERFLSDGKREQALALYTFLSGPQMPQAARHGAMSAIVREETSTRRPR
jgi:HEAT repeat protein